MLYRFLVSVWAPLKYNPNITRAATHRARTYTFLQFLKELIPVVLKFTGLKQVETLTPSRIHRQMPPKKKRKKMHSSFSGPVLSTVAEGDETEESDDGYF